MERNRVFTIDDLPDTDRRTVRFFRGEYDTEDDADRLICARSASLFPWNIRAETGNIGRFRERFRASFRV
jgi:hypothetical protein